VTALRAAPGGLQLGRHLWIAGRTLLYLLLGLVQGTVNALLVGAGLALSAPLSLVAVGGRLLDRVARLTWRLGENERHQANRLLGAHLAPIAQPGHRGLEDLGRPAFWRVVAMLLLRLPVSLAGLAAAAAPVALGVALLVLGVDGLGGDDGQLVGPWRLGPVLGVALCVLAAAAAVLTVAVLDGVGHLVRALSRLMLRSRTPAEGPVRELLAERLGDQTLNVAYWLPDREMFVDERGHRVELPDPASGRAWTAVERDGRRVAALVHDAELDATPELVHAAASAAALAIDNERLKADLRARVEELRVSRLRIVQASDEARRRIERDLHDGAQQQLVSLALDIRTLRARLKADGAPEALDALGAKLADALAELRELARGIHPAILTDRGPGPAIDALAARSGLPVECEVDPGPRPPRAVEAAAYFVVAEALTNVAKYARASHARVRVRRRGDDLEVVVSDDGVGGARVEGGTGLRGLADRVAALDGRLTVESPPGGGTRVEARIPWRGQGGAG